MALFKRVYCPFCKQAHNLYEKDGRKKKIFCSRCQREMPIKKGEGIYYIEYYFEKRRKREAIGPYKELAKNALYSRKKEIVENKYFDIKKEDKIKFDDFTEEYEKLHSSVNNRSWERSGKYIIARLKKHFGNKYLNEITPHMVDKFKAERKTTVSVASVNRELQCLKSIFNKAIVWEKFSGTNPVTKIKLFKENNQRLRFLEKEEIAKLLSNCNKQLRSIVVIALNTGMRRGEILGLKLRDIDIKRGVIHLYNTKNNEKREIPINEQVKTALIRTRKHPQSEYIFCKKDGSSFGHTRKSFDTALKKSGIKDFTFHDLRHTMASHLVMAGIDLNTVRELLGHKSLAMTLRYSHLSPNHKQRAVDVLSKRMDTIWTLNKNETNKGKQLQSVSSEYQTS